VVSNHSGLHGALTTVTQRYVSVVYEGVSIISMTGAAICTVVVVARCNGRNYHILGVSVQNFMQLGGCSNFFSHVCGPMQRI
jgi:hypothetical protein